MEQKHSYLTQKLVDESIPASTEYIIWDTQLRGYGVLIHPNGKAVFIVQWRDVGRDTGRDGTNTRRMTLGPISNMTEGQARDAARQFFMLAAPALKPITALKPLAAAKAG
jgi:hypothetical protein